MRNVPACNVACQPWAPVLQQVETEDGNGIEPLCVPQTIGRQNISPDLLTFFVIV